MHTISMKLQYMYIRKKKQEYQDCHKHGFIILKDFWPANKKKNVINKFIYAFPILS